MITALAQLLKPFARLWRYDLPRQVALTFLAAFAITAAIGYLIAALDQVESEQIAGAEVRGEREGAFDGQAEGRAAGQTAGAEQAASELPALLAAGDPDAARALARWRSWNLAVEIALEQARRQKLELEDIFTEWERLLE